MLNLGTQMLDQLGKVVPEVWILRFLMLLLKDTQLFKKFGVSNPSPLDLHQR